MLTEVARAFRTTRSPLKLPALLEEQLRQLVSQYPHDWLKKDAARLSATLQSRTLDHFTPMNYSAKDSLSYLVSRLPSTFGAASSVLSHIQSVEPKFVPRTILDFGSGPGTASLAALSMFHDAFREDPHHKDTITEKVQATLVEPNQYMATAAQQLFAAPHLSELCSSSIMPVLSSGRKHDLVIAGYALNEVSNSRELLVKTAVTLADACSQYLVLIEPGTPAGFDVLRTIRDSFEVQNRGFDIIAPCPQSMKPCPMGTSSWCHFSARLQRPLVQRRVKQNFGRMLEDERYSFLVFRNRNASSTSAAHSESNGEMERHSRLVSIPLKRSGHVVMDVCHPEGGLKRQVFARSLGQENGYRFARKARWGDSNVFLAPSSEVVSPMALAAKKKRLPTGFYQRDGSMSLADVDELDSVDNASALDEDMELDHDHDDIELSQEVLADSTAPQVKKKNR